MTDGEREQIKLRANALDRASTACLAVGLLAPLANLLYNGGAGTNGFGSFCATVVYLVAALVLHHSALRHLKELDK
jgi:hypothetical protein